MKDHDRVVSGEAYLNETMLGQVTLSFDWEHVPSISGAVLYNDDGAIAAVSHTTGVNLNSNGISIGSGSVTVAGVSGGIAGASSVPYSNAGGTVSNNLSGPLLDYWLDEQIAVRLPPDPAPVPRVARPPLREGRLPRGIALDGL